MSNHVRDKRNHARDKRNHVRDKPNSVLGTHRNHQPSNEFSTRNLKFSDGRAEVGGELQFDQPPHLNLMLHDIVLRMEVGAALSDQFQPHLKSRHLLL